MNIYMPKTEILEKSAVLNTRAIVPFHSLKEFNFFFLAKFSDLPAGYKPEGLSSQTLL